LARCCPFVLSISTFASWEFRRFQKDIFYEGIAPSAPYEVKVTE